MACGCRGDTQGAYDLTSTEVLITGRNGLLIAGPNAKDHEPALILYLQLHSRNMFMRVFFTRTFVLGDELRKIRDMIGLAQFAHSRESGGVAVGDPAIVDKVSSPSSLQHDGCFALLLCSMALTHSSCLHRCGTG